MSVGIDILKNTNMARRLQHLSETLSRIEEIKSKKLMALGIHQDSGRLETTKDIHDLLKLHLEIKFEFLCVLMRK